MRDRGVSIGWSKGSARNALACVSSGFILAVFAALAGVHPTAAQENPPLSEEIRRVFEEGGVEAVEARYKEILEGETDAYEFDTQTMMVIASEYAQAGNLEGAQAFYTIGSQMAVADFQRSDIGVQLNAMMDSANRTDQSEGTGQVASAQGGAAVGAMAGGEAVGGPDQGPTREDLARFFGLYGDPNPPGTVNHDIMVSQTCDGRLFVAPMWADVAPYILRSEGDTRFVQIWVNDFQPTAYQLDFALSPTGQPTSVRHNITAEYGFERWARAGDLPEGYTDCLNTLR